MMKNDTILVMEMETLKVLAKNIIKMVENSK
jgi:hypothetical protein